MKPNWFKSENVKSDYSKSLYTACKHLFLGGGGSLSRVIVFAGCRFDSSFPQSHVVNLFVSEWMCATECGRVNVAVVEGALSGQYD